MINIPVKIPGLERRRRSVGLLHMVAGFFLIANADRVYKLYAQNSYLPLVPLILVAIISLLYGVFRSRWDVTSKYNFSLRLLQAATFFGYALTFILSGFSDRSFGLGLWVAIAVMLAFSERIALQEQHVVFTDKGFGFPAGYRQKQVSWPAVADVTLRPDFLTIHYKDNRFLQFELAQPLSPEKINSLQDFCRRQTGSAAAAG